MTTLAQIISSVSRSNTYPTYTTLVNSNSILVSFNTIDWTEQMLNELPSIKLTFYKLINSVYVNQRKTTVLNMNSLNGSFILSDMPMSLVVGIEPLFDDNALFAHNCKVINKTESNLWETLTNVFNITIDITDNR